MNELLMTGGSGLVGSQLGPMLTDRFQVVTIGRTKPNWSRNHLTCDFSTPWESPVLPQSYHTLVHLAQSDHFREFPEKAEAIFDTNVRTLIKLLEHARKSEVKRVVLASSGGVYGYGKESFAESDLLKARDDLGFYLGTKFAAEILASNYTQYFDLIILRFFFIYGPGQKPGMLIPRLIKAVDEGRAITLQGDNGIRLNPIYVEDAASAVEQALQLDGFHRINIAGPEAVTLRTLCGTIGSILGKVAVFSVDDSTEPKHLVGDISQMGSKLGIPRTGLGQGLKSAIVAMKPGKQ